MKDTLDSPDLNSTPRIVTALLLLMAAILFYLPGLPWGAPQATAPDRVKTFATDEILPLEALAEMHSTFVESKLDRNYGYPWWHYFVVSASQAPYLAYLALTDQIQSPTPAYPFGLEDPVSALRALTLIGRSVSILMGAGIVVSAYFLSTILWSHQVGVVAALLTMLNYLMVFYSGTGNLDVPALFWSALGMVVFAKILTSEISGSRAAWLGIFAACAMATKEQSLIFFLPMAAILVIPGGAVTRADGSRFRVLAIGCLSFAIAYVLATGMIVDPQRHLTHLSKLFIGRDTMSDAPMYFATRPLTQAGLFHQSIDFVRDLAAVMGAPILAASVVGMYLSWRNSPRYLLLLLPALVLFFFFFLPAGVVIRRYLLPLTLIIDAFAARAAVAVRMSTPRAVWLPLLILMIGWRLVVAVDLTYARQLESRSSASEWLITHASTGDRVEYFGVAETMPHLPAEIKSRRIMGRTDWVGETDHGPEVLRYLETEGPEYVVTVPDWTSHQLDHSGDCPLEVFDALMDGSVGYELAAYFPSRSAIGGWIERPRLDSQMVCPPVRIFARRDILHRELSHASIP